MGNLEPVAAELVLQICSYLPQKDVANFRLTCKRHAELGAEHLTKEVHLMFRPKSFQNMVNIASHPVFSKHVTSLVYEADIAHFAIDHSMWKHYVSNDKKYLKKKEPTTAEIEDHMTSVSRHYLSMWEAERQAYELYRGPKKYTKQQVRDGWSAFKHIQEETGSIAETSEDFKALHFAFGSFPNLKEVSMQIGGKVSEAMKLSFKKALYLPELDILPAIMPDVERGFHVGTRQLSAILEATVATGIPLRSLTAGKLDLSFFGTQPIQYHQVVRNKRFNFENPWWTKPYSKRFEPAFRNLTDIDLRFEELVRDDELDMDDEAEEARHKLLGTALKSAKKLKSLTLHFGETDEDMNNEGDTPQIVTLENLLSGSPLDKIIWPKLEFLELHSVGASYESWMAFMQAHSATLRTLCLSSLQLTYKDDENDDEDEGEEPVLSWSRLLTDLREVLHGKHVEFRGVFSTEDDYGFDGDFHMDPDARWFPMDQEVPTLPTDGPSGDVRFGKLVQKWYADPLGTEDNPIAKYGHLFKDDEGYGNDSDGGFFHDHGFGPIPSPFGPSGIPPTPQMLQNMNPHTFMQHLMSSIHGTPLTPQMVMQHLMQTGNADDPNAAEDDDDDDDESMPDLISIDAATGNGAAEDDTDSLPDLISVDAPAENGVNEDDADSID